MDEIQYYCRIFISLKIFFNNWMGRKLLFYLALALAFLMLQAPAFVWWCNTSMGSFLARVRPTVSNDVVAISFGVVGIIGAWVCQLDCRRRAINGAVPFPGVCFLS